MYNIYHRTLPFKKAKNSETYHKQERLILQSNFGKRTVPQRNSCSRMNQDKLNDTNQHEDDQHEPLSISSSFQSDIELKQESGIQYNNFVRTVEIMSVVTNTTHM